MIKKISLVMVIMALSASVCAFAEDNAPKGTAPTSWKVGYLVPSEGNFSLAALVGVSLQTDLGQSYVGALDFDLSPATDCNDDTPGVVTNRCRVKHRIAALTVKKKISFSGSNNKMTLGGGVVYMMSDVTIAETYQQVSYNYHDSSNQFGGVIQMELDNIIDRYPGIFFQARYIHAGEQAAAVTRMTNKIGGLTISTGYRFEF